jgi:hypothetical protein
MRKLYNSVFGWGSPMAMGVFRAIFGLVALINWLMMWPFWETWFSEKGYVPTEAVQIFLGPTPRFAPLNVLTDPGVIQFAYALLLMFCVTTMLGLFTRFSTIALFLLTVAFHMRNPILLHGGDTLLRNMCFLLALAPAGAAFSLDRRIAEKRAGKPLPIEDVSLWPQRLMVFQLVLVYLTTVWAKSYGNLWREGKATWFPPQLTEFERFPVPTFLNSPPAVMVTTYGTLLVELALGTLIFWKPARRWVVLSGLALHAGIEYQFNIPMFAATITSCYLLYYSGEEVSQFIDKIKTKWISRNVQEA